VQFRLTIFVIFTHCELTARVLNGSQVQFPVGQLKGGVRSVRRLEERTPLYVAAFIL
jgi:hypothetical protein